MPNSNAGPRSKKYQQLLNAAEELFFKYSVKRVSVEEICRKAGVSKMTFYRHFANKHALAERLIYVLFEEACNRLDATARLDVPFTKKLDIMLSYKLEFVEKMSAEFIEEYLDLAQDTITPEWIRKVMQFLTYAQQRGEIRADLSPEFIMFMADKMSEIVKDKRMVHFYTDYGKMTRDVWNLFYYGLLPRKDEE